jgi:hypothetical protein
MFHDDLQATGAPISSLSDIETKLEAEWNALTRTGNQAFVENGGANACRFYADALATAEHLFDAALRGGSPFLAPMVYNISCANAAEAVLRAGDRCAARMLLIRALDRLLTTAESPSSPVALRVNCVRHLHYPFGILARDFANEMQACDVRELLARASAVLIKVHQLQGEITEISGAQGYMADAQRYGVPRSSRSRLH